MTPNQYRYKCPTEGCEIDSILVNVHEDVIEYFGFCCPFCQDHMVRDDTYQSEREKVLTNIIELVDARIEGLDSLMATPAEQRTESAQDKYLKEARFELGLVQDEYRELRQAGE